MRGLSWLMNWLSSRFELARGGAAHHLAPMEGLRGFAVFLVFLVHYATLCGPWLPQASGAAHLAHLVHAVGNAGVDLFFVLSGFLIYGSLMQRAQPFIAFMRRRVVRIYPVFLVMFALYLALSFARPQDSKLPAGAFEALLYIGQNLLLLPGLFPIEPIITVAWSLSYEMFYYLAMPLVVGAFALRARSRAWRCVFFLAVGAAILAACALWGGPVRLAMFIAGVLLFETLGARVKAPASAAGAAALAAGLAVTLLPLPGSAGYAARIALQALCFFYACHAMFGGQRTPLAHAFSWTPMRWLGNMSYSYYLMHGLALKAGFLVVAGLVPPATDPWLVLAGLVGPMFVLTLLPSALLFLWVERPLSLAPPAPRLAAAAA